MKYTLIVFDLDFTLWNAGGVWCDQTCPPYRKTNGHVLDATDNQLFLYPDTKTILEELSTQYLLGVASRTTQPSWAMELMELFGIRHFFNHIEIYPGSKTAHFKHLHARSGIPFDKMLFFDDEERNINEVRRLNANCVLVDAGITRELIQRHL